MFGYACRETDELMPLPITLAHKICKRLAEVRMPDELHYLRPDGKAQVTVRYEVDEHGVQRPVEIERVLISTQHADGIDSESLIKPDLIERVLQPILPRDLYDEGRLEHKDFVYVNPTGRFVVGGPMGDTGLTGRKIIVDTYGGAARHGGGAFSGKDPTKVDRSAAYAARYVAKNVVAAGLADRCELQVAYAIGIAQPFSIQVECFGTEAIPVARIRELVVEHFDLRPAAILRDLDLRRPIYAKTAAYGHFGRDDRDFTWEQTDKADALREAAGPRPRSRRPSRDGRHRRRLGRVRRARDAVRQARAHPRRCGDALRARGELLHRRARRRRRRRRLRRRGVRRLPVARDQRRRRRADRRRPSRSSGPVATTHDMQVAQTIDTQLNVFADFDPVLSSGARASRVTFLANIQPDLQRRVREQCSGAVVTGLDSMNYWIESARESLLETIACVDVVSLNDTEVRMLTGRAESRPRRPPDLRARPARARRQAGQLRRLHVHGERLLLRPGLSARDGRRPDGRGRLVRRRLLRLPRLAISSRGRSPTRCSGAPRSTARWSRRSRSRSSAASGCRRLTLHEIEARFAEFRQMTHFEAQPLLVPATEE